MTNTTTPADTLRITVADLTLRVDDRVATYKHGDRTFTVISVPDAGWTVPELIAYVKAAGDEPNLDPWVSKIAYDSGIRLDF